MSDADLFRQYAKEAMHESSKTKSKSEERTLATIACTWAQAALMSEKVRRRATLAKPHTPHFPFGAGSARSRQRDCGL
jgi:hypothetical protein